MAACMRKHQEPGEEHKRPRSLIARDMFQCELSKPRYESRSIGVKVNQGCGRLRGLIEKEHSDDTQLPGRGALAHAFGFGYL